MLAEEGTLNAYRDYVNSTRRHFCLISCFPWFSQGGSRPKYLGAGIHSPPLTSLPLFFRSPSCLFPHLPLDEGPLKYSYGFWEERCKLCQWRSNFVHFSLKIWRLVASDLVIFLRISWPQCVNSMAKFGEPNHDLWGGLCPPPPLSPSVEPPLGSH